MKRSFLQITARIVALGALAARYRGTKPAALEERTDLTSGFVAVVVRTGINTMPFLRPTEVSDDDLKALGTYLARKRD